MNLNQLHYFVKLAKVEHYTKAAKEISITQPSLSHSISLLEEELGTYLFEKEGRNVHLTKYGKVFLEYVEKSLEILNEGIEETKLLTSESSGVIDLGYIYTLGAEFVPEMMTEFLDLNEDKNIKFTLSSGNTTDIIKKLKDGKIDIAFCSKMENEKDIEFVKIKEEELVVVVPKNHPLSNKKRINLLETVMYNHITYNNLSGIRPTIDSLFRKIGKTQKIAYEVEKDDCVAGLVAKDRGIAIMPNIPLLKYLDVDVLEISTPEYSRDIYMARVKNKYLPPVISDFYKFIINETKEELDINYEDEGKSYECC